MPTRASSLQAVVSDHEGGPCWTVFHHIPCQVTTSELSTDASEGLYRASSLKEQELPKTAALSTESKTSAAVSLSDAITSQLSHPATTPIPSLLDLPVASATSDNASSIILPGEADSEALDAYARDLDEVGAGRKNRSPRRKNAKSPEVPHRVGGGIKIAAGGGPAGSRLAAMVGDSEYYETSNGSLPDDEPQGSQHP